MMALGDELRADDNVEAARGDVVELGAQPIHGGDEIRGEHQHARLRKQFAHLFFEPLDSGPAGDEGIECGAFRALVRMRHAEAAMVADQLFLETMIDQPGVAIRTGEAEAAGAA